MPLKFRSAPTLFCIAALPFVSACVSLDDLVDDAINDQIDDSFFAPDLNRSEAEQALTRLRSGRSEIETLPESIEMSGYMYGQLSDNQDATFIANLNVNADFRSNTLSGDISNVRDDSDGFDRPFEGSLPISGSIDQGSFTLNAEGRVTEPGANLDLKLSANGEFYNSFNRLVGEATGSGTSYENGEGSADLDFTAYFTD